MIGHLTITGRYLIDKIADLDRQDKQQDFVFIEGKMVANEIARKWLLREMKDGRSAWGCPEPNPDGTCPGHE